MKKIITMFSVAVLALTAVPATAQIAPTSASIIDALILTPTENGSYLYINGIGGAGGFAEGSTGVSEAIFTAASGDIDIVGQVLGVGTDVAVEETNVGAGTFTARIFSPTSDDLCPSGFIVGGMPADTCGFFMGADGGGTSLAFDSPACVSSASIELLSNGANLAGPFDITGFPDFTAGPAGDWDGSLSVSFGAGSTGLDIDEAILIVVYQKAADCSDLPVELSNFESEVIDGDILLQWTTSTESENLGFDLEHSVDGITFAALSFIDGAGSTTETSNYNFTVSDLEAGMHYFRLKQIDFDGTSTYSDVVEATIDVLGTHEISGVYPNPLAAQGSMDLVVAEDQSVSIGLYDLQGRQVLNIATRDLLANQITRLELDLSTVPSGTYFVVAQGKNFVQSEYLVLMK